MEHRAGGRLLAHSCWQLGHFTVGWNCRCHAEGESAFGVGLRSACERFVHLSWTGGGDFICGTGEASQSTGGPERRVWDGQEGVPRGGQSGVCRAEVGHLSLRKCGRTSESVDTAECAVPREGSEVTLLVCAEGRWLDRGHRFMYFTFRGRFPGTRGEVFMTLLRNNFCGIKWHTSVRNLAHSKRSKAGEGRENC